MPAINDRIRELRKAKGLTMEQFGDVIGLTKATVSRLESGAVSATEQTVKSICREFGVSEAWLRTGEGPMLDDTSGSILDRLTAEYHLDDRKRAILTAFLKLSPADQDAILRYVDGVVSELNAQPAAPDLDVDAEVEAYRRSSWPRKKRRPLRQLPLAPPPGDRCIGKKEGAPRRVLPLFCCRRNRMVQFSFSVRLFLLY